MSQVPAIDQGTTSARAIVFYGSVTPIASAQEEFPQHYPATGWLEHDPEDIWTTTLRTARASRAQAPGPLAAIGITNQRDTVVLRDRETGRPVHNAIVWQDRRTAKTTAALREAGHERMVQGKTGLLLDPYFSGSKLARLLENVNGAREKARDGKLAFGTMDSWLTGGRRHVSDATNAARTLLHNIRKGVCDDDILRLLNIPASLLPEVLDTGAESGTTEAEIFGEAVAIRGVAGDQQAATLGQACLEPGMPKSTYRTGRFALLNTGETLVDSRNRLLAPIAYQFDGKPSYALEGSIFIAGAVVQWLRDGLEIIDAAPQGHALAEAADPSQTLYLVPAVTGLGAPYWDPDSRGAIFGLTRNTGRAEIARAALESVGFQARDLREAMAADWHGTGAGNVLRVDGGMTASDWTMQFLADILGAPVDRPKVLETTALGSDRVAEMQAGLYPGFDDSAKAWAVEHEFHPQMDADTCEARYAGWEDAVARTLSTRA
jgi:glycerol kinase